jgi:hypothetical protein
MKVTVICGSRHQLLKRQVARCIVGSHMTLDALHDATGINRAKLGRMRLEKGPVSFDEAEAVFRATQSPSRAMVLLACLEEERVLTPQVLNYLEHFLGALPSLLDRLNDLGPMLNPQWAQGSAHYIGTLMAEHADRRCRADLFVPVAETRLSA